MEEQELNDEQKQALRKTDISRSALYEFGKKYFKGLLANEHPNMKFGDELKFGIRFYGKDGKSVSEIVETIHKDDL